jgi:hypothetical protein
LLALHIGASAWLRYPKRNMSTCRHPCLLYFATAVMPRYDRNDSAEPAIRRQSQKTRAMKRIS